MERATETILRELQSENVREIPTRVVGLKVMEHLKEIDPVAFVRYASVYRAFADVGEFIEEIASMEREPTTKDGLQPDLFSP
jgi:transcriptional repressor NrdR